MLLKELRAAKKFTQKQLSDASGVSQAFISEVEKGSKKPGLDVLKAIARALDCSIDELVADPENHIEG